MSSDITVVIPHIPPRGELLARTLTSVWEQILLPDAVSIAVDTSHEGAGPTRTRALRQAQTKWVAFVDDDDELLPHHLETLLAHADHVGADVVWPWFRVVSGTDPIPDNQGRQWDPADPHTFPMTTLVRTSYAQQGTFPEPLPDAGCSGEDFAFWMQMSNLGARFHHVNVITWLWDHATGNTSGMPDRW
jgi:glycosyltransferase involved in cell wall biosynthesis